MRFHYFIYVAVLVMHYGFAQQKIGTNRTNMNPNAIFEMEATNKGMLLPRVELTSTSSFAPMAAHVNGLTVYNLATANDVTPGVYYNDGTKWIRVGQSLPAGGTANQVLVKVDGTDYNTQWSTLNTSGDLRLVNTSSHITQDAGVGSNGSSAGNEHVIAIGNQAGNANSGRYNVFVGSSTGKSNTTGENNTFLGFRAGEANTTASWNTFVGNWAGQLNSGGNWNSFFGNNSGLQNTTGFSNSFFGTEAGRGNTTGYRNVAIGLQALDNNAGGVYNIAIGVLSLKNSSNGAYNVAIGEQSLSALTNASNNTAIGSLSLLYTTTGANNIAIGRSSGENITTGSNNIAIGVSSFVPSATANNQLSIGNLIYGVNLNGSGNTISTGNIGIGTTSPSEKLDVAGAVKFSGALMPNNTAGTSGQVLTSAGSGNAPTWTTLSSNSSIYNSNGSLTQNRTVALETNNLSFTSSATTGTNHFSIDGSTFSLDAFNNRIGIGTTTPARNLDIVGNGARLGIISPEAQSSGLFFGTNWNTDVNGALKTAIIAQGINSWSRANLHFCLKSDGGNGSGDTASINDTKMMIRNDGNIGIGTTNPSSKLDVAGGKIKLDVSQTLTINPSDNFSHNGNSMSHYGIGWFNDSWENGGSTAYLSGYGGIKFFTEGNLRMGIERNGTTRNITGSWSTFSDARIKTVKEEFKEGLNVIKAIKPVRFVYNEKAPFKSNEVQIGIIAQDLEQIAPYMVNKTTHEGITDLREVNTQAYVFLLINAVKEQQQQIEELKKEIELLKKD